MKTLALVVFCFFATNAVLAQTALQSTEKLDYDINM